MTAYEHTARYKRLARELSELEDDYRAVVRKNPRHIEAVRKHLVYLDSVVLRMREIRNSKTINMPVRKKDLSWLQEIISGTRNEGDRGQQKRGAQQLPFTFTARQ